MRQSVARPGKFAATPTRFANLQVQLVLDRTGYEHQHVDLVEGAWC